MDYYLKVYQLNKKLSIDTDFFLWVDSSEKSILKNFLKLKLLWCSKCLMSNCSDVKCSYFKSTKLNFQALKTIKTKFCKKKICATAKFFWKKGGCGYFFVIFWLKFCIFFYSFMALSCQIVFKIVELIHIGMLQSLFQRMLCCETSQRTYSSGRLIFQDLNNVPFL